MHLVYACVLMVVV